VSDDAYPDWEAAYRDNVGRLYRLMYSRVGNRPDAEDLTAETFRAALGPLDLALSKGEVRSYLLVTARTVLASHWRVRLGHPVTSIDAERDIDVMADDPVPGPAGDAPLRAERILSALPDRYRRILELRFVEAGVDQGGGEGHEPHGRQRQGAPAPGAAHGHPRRIGVGAVTGRRLRAFVDALAEGRRPPAFRADPDDLDDLRTAITLSAARPGGSDPDPRFVEELFAELRQAQGARSQPEATVTPIHRRGRNVVVSLAAAAALVGGTFAVTESVDHGASRPAASAVAGHTVLTGSFETSDHRKLGQITVFGGSPSWVFMNLAGVSYNGPVKCLLESDRGSVVATGAFSVAGGTGEWARPLPAGVANLAGATIVTSTGVTLASATFSDL
jgi:RNA polymerase sigma-70 factor (ECF subfamily)